MRENTVKHCSEHSGDKNRFLESSWFVLLFACCTGGCAMSSSTLLLLLGTERFSCNCSFFLFCSCSLRCSCASDNSAPLFNLDHWAMSLFLKAFSIRGLAATTYHILTLDLDETKMYASPFFSPLLSSLDFVGGEPWSRAQCAADL